MKYEAFRDGLYVFQWRVLATDSEGRRYVADFGGHEAEKRAKAYAEWMNHAKEADTLREALPEVSS